MKSMALKMNQKLYYGWVIVALSSLAFFFSAPGQTYSISVFINAYQETFQYSSTLISSGYSIATTLSGLLLIFMGKAVDRFGQRTMMLIAGTMLAVTAFYNSFVANIGMIFIGFFFLRYFGQGSLTLIPSSLVPQWFEQRRALALSLATLGGLIATLLVPSFNLWLIGQLGWAQAWRVWSLLLAGVFLPMVYVFVFNRPESLGMMMENQGEIDEETLQIALNRLNKESFTLNETLRSKVFWTAGIISLIVPMFTTAVTFHFFAIMRLRDVSNEQAAFIIGLVAFPMFFMPFVAKLLIERVKTSHLFFFTQSMILLSMAFLAWAVQGALSATVFILFYGTMAAIQNVALNVLWPDFFGRKYLGSIRGAATVFMVIGSALGPLPFGISYDLTGSFNPVIYGMMIFTIVTSLMALTLKKPTRTHT